LNDPVFQFVLPVTFTFVFYFLFVSCMSSGSIEAFLLLWTGMKNEQFGIVDDEILFLDEFHSIFSYR